MYVTVGDYRYDVLSSLNILRFDSTLVKFNLVVLFNPYLVYKLLLTLLSMPWEGNAIIYNSEKE